MFKINDCVVYKRDVCIITDIKENHYNNKDYYILIPIDDKSLKIDVPVDNKSGYLRNLIKKEDVEEIINSIPNILAIDCTDRMIENEYKTLMNSGRHDDLIRIIKTTYSRNKERVDNNKKIGDKDNDYFHLAEKYLYNEFSIVLGMNFDETRNYVIKKVSEINK